MPSQLLVCGELYSHHCCSGLPAPGSECRHAQHTAGGRTCCLVHLILIPLPLVLFLFLRPTVACRPALALAAAVAAQLFTLFCLCPLLVIRELILCRGKRTVVSALPCRWLAAGWRPLEGGGQEAPGWARDGYRMCAPDSSSWFSWSILAMAASILGKLWAIAGVKRCCGSGAHACGLGCLPDTVHTDWAFLKRRLQAFPFVLPTKIGLAPGPALVIDGTHNTAFSA